MSVDIHTLQATAAKLRKNNPQLRKGQSLMGALHIIDPEAYKQITGTPVDCFYNDTLIDKFLTHLTSI